MARPYKLPAHTHFRHSAVIIVLPLNFVSSEKDKLKLIEGNFIFYKDKKIGDATH